MSNNFSTNLRTLRGSRKKAEFSRLLGVSAPVYQRYEDGRIPRSDVLSVIANRLSVTVEWLLSDHENSIGNRVAESYSLRKNSALYEKPSEECEGCSRRDRRIAELEAERDFLRDQVSRLVIALPGKDKE